MLLDVIYKQGSYSLLDELANEWPRITTWGKKSNPSSFPPFVFCFKINSLWLIFSSRNGGGDSIGFDKAMRHNWSQHAKYLSQDKILKSNFLISLSTQKLSVEEIKAATARCVFQPWLCCLLSWLPTYVLSLFYLVFF